MSAPHLTSAERRGILSVAVAALICIGAGIAVRQCHSNYVQTLPPRQVDVNILTDTVPTADRTTTPDRSTTSKNKGRHSGKKKHPAKSARKKTPVSTPTPRDFLNDTIPTR